MSQPRVVIIGAGAIGLLYGGWLVAGGLPASLLARDDATAALAGGVTLSGPGGDRQLNFAAVTSDPAALAGAEVVIIATKLYDLDQASATAAAMLAPGGVIVAIQNGVNAQEILAGRVPHDQILVGPVYSPARKTGPAKVTFPRARNSVILGNPFGPIHPFGKELIAAWQRAGVDASLSDDIRTVQWSKFLGLVTNAALTALARLPAGVLYHDTRLLDLARRSVAEAAAVARADGVALGDDAEASAMALLQGFPADVVASMRQDLDAGRRLELDGLSGLIVRKGLEHGVPTPFHDLAYACLLPFVDGPPAAAEIRR